MKNHDKKIEALETALKTAYLKKPGHPLKPEWEREVMSHVRWLSAAPAGKGLWETPLPQKIYDFSGTPVVWRTAAAVCTCALITLVYAVINNIGPEYEAARFLLEDPLGFTFAQPLFP